MLPPSLLLPADVSLVCPVPACSTMTTSPKEYLEHAKKWHLPEENQDRLLNLLGHAFRKGEDRKKSLRKVEDKLQAQVAHNRWNPLTSSKYEEDYEVAQAERCTVNMPRATIHKPLSRELPPLDLSLLSPRRPIREALGKRYCMKATKPRILVTKSKSRYFDYDVDADSRPIMHPPPKVKKVDKPAEQHPSLSPPVQDVSPPPTTSQDNEPIVKMEVVDTEYEEPPVPRESLTPPPVEIKSEVEEETEKAATATAHVQASSGVIYPALVVPSKLGDSSHPVLLHRMGNKCYVFQWKLSQANSERYVCLSCKMMKRTTGIRVINNMFQGDPERLPHSCQKRDWAKEAGNRKLYLHLQNLKDLKPTPSPVAAYQNMMRVDAYEEKEEELVEEGGNESLDERLNAFLASTSKEMTLERVGQVAEPIPINHRKREKQICFRLGPQRYLQQGVPKVDIVCQNCGETVRRIPSPTDHVHMHMHEEGCSPFECSLCDFSHHERTQVFRHMRTEHGRSDELIKDNRFIYAAQLKQITLSCFPNAVYVLKDPPHLAEVQSLEGGVREVQIVIPDEPSGEFLNEIEEEEPYNSGVANSQLTQLLGGKRYLTVSSRRKDRVRLKCQFAGCGVTSDKPVDHAYHHMESKLFGCAFCPDFTSTDRLEVWRHMRVIHNVAGAKVWDYRFRYAEELKKMMMACYPENFVNKPLPTKDLVLDLKWGTGYVVLD